jgi:hypothetical protein
MASLKALLPRLAPIIGMSVDALYERQRALVRHGVLRPVAGRGPGSGVEFSADSVAALLISIGATDSLSEVDGRIVGYCEAKSTTGKCPLTGEKKLRGAIEAILKDPVLSSDVSYITIDHGSPYVTIQYRGDVLSAFIKSKTPAKGLRAFSQIDTKFLAEISNLIQETYSS